MINLKSAWTAVAIAAVLALLGTYFGMRAGVYEFELGLGTHALQTTLDKTLELPAQPQETVQISSIRIGLSDNHISLDIDAITDYRPLNTDTAIPLNVHAQSTGAVNYDKSGSFYLKSEQLTQKGLTVGEELTVYPALTINTQDLQQAVDNYLRKRPLFNMTGLGSSWTQGHALLKNVQVQDGMIYTTLSMWQITDGLVMALLALLACAAAAVALAFASFRRG